ncbi:hypothetical protein ACHAW6_005089 [Cyclotella cf. meneghiniana]
MPRSKAISLFLLSAIGITQAFVPQAPSPRSNFRHGVSQQLAMALPDKNQVLTSRRAALSSFLASTAAILASTVAPPQASAAESRTIAQISGSGLVFKDTLVVESFDDPKVKGVTLYVSNFERPLTERLQKDFFTEPSYASVTCVRNGKEIEVADNIDKTDKGEPVFEEKRSLLFKELRVQRIYDAEKNTVVYVSFNTRLDKNSDTNKSRFKSSICAVSLD